MGSLDAEIYGAVELFYAKLCQLLGLSHMYVQSNLSK